MTDFPNSLALAGKRGLLKNSWITVIDENGFWLGEAMDTLSVRRKLRSDGFEIANGCATLQTGALDADGHKKGHGATLEDGQMSLTDFRGGDTEWRTTVF